MTRWTQADDAAQEARARHMLEDGRRQPLSTLGLILFAVVLVLFGSQIAWGAPASNHETKTSRAMKAIGSTLECSAYYRIAANGIEPITFRSITIKTYSIMRADTMLEFASTIAVKNRIPVDRLTLIQKIHIDRMISELAGSYKNFPILVHKYARKCITLGRKAKQ